MPAGREAPRTRLLGVGAYAPTQVMTNDDLAKIVDTSDEWVRERTGIIERRVAADGQATSDMAFEASKKALDRAGLSASDLEMIIVGTVTPDMPFPATAALLQQKLGVSNIPSYDVSAACAGFLYAMSIGDQYIRSGSLKHVLIVGGELLTRVMNWQDRSTCILFGDGAGAAVLGPANGDGRGVLSTKLHTDSTLAMSLCIPAGGSAEPLTAQALEEQRNKVHMIGRDIFKIAVRNLTSASKGALESAGLSADEIDWVVPHQANLRILSQVAERLSIPMDRFVLNIDRYGNTSSASVPLALDEGIEDGRIKPGQTVLMCALGAGISWASALVRM